MDHVVCIDANKYQINIRNLNHLEDPYFTEEKSNNVYGLLRFQTHYSIQANRILLMDGFPDIETENYLKERIDKNPVLISKNMIQCSVPLAFFQKNNGTEKDRLIPDPNECCPLGFLHVRLQQCRYQDWEQTMEKCVNYKKKDMIQIYKDILESCIITIQPLENQSEEIGLMHIFLLSEFITELNQGQKHQLQVLEQIMEPVRQYGQNRLMDLCNEWENTKGALDKVDLICF